LSEAHFHLHGLEVIGHAGLDLSSHALPGPLFEAIEFLVDVHLGKCEMVVAERQETKRWEKGMLASEGVIALMLALDKESIW
jgi:hypothetical protein